MKIKVVQFVDNSQTESFTFRSQKSFLKFMSDQTKNIPLEINSVSFDITITK